jgi:hypothetical protein
MAGRKKILLALAILVVVVVGVLIYRRKEHYGGNQESCEAQCYSSEYYDFCMDTCLTGSTQEWTGRADEYLAPPLEEPIPLEDENSKTGYASTYAGLYVGPFSSLYRGETPGR